MTAPVRRRPVAVLFALALLALCFGQASPASADPLLPLNWRVDATSTFKSLNQTVNLSGGSFVGSVDLANGNLTGDLSLPRATAPVKLAGLPLANATFEVVPTKPVSGHVDLATLTASTTSEFNIRLVALRPTLLPINLVGNRCQTATPISMTLAGPVSLTGASTFSGTYTVPKFKDCGLLVTPVLNLIIPSAGNTFSATFSPNTPA